MLFNGQLQPVMMQSMNHNSKLNEVRYSEGHKVVAVIKMNEKVNGNNNCTVFSHFLTSKLCDEERWDELVPQDDNLLPICLQPQTEGGREGGRESTGVVRFLLPQLTKAPAWHWCNPSCHPVLLAESRKWRVCPLFVSIVSYSLINNHVSESLTAKMFFTQTLTQSRKMVKPGLGFCKGTRDGFH